MVLNVLVAFAFGASRNMNETRKKTRIFFVDSETTTATSGPVASVKIHLLIAPYDVHHHIKKSSAIILRERERESFEMQESKLRVLNVYNHHHCHCHRHQHHASVHIFYSSFLLFYNILPYVLDGHKCCVYSSFGFESQFQWDEFGRGKRRRKYCIR